MLTYQIILPFPISANRIWRYTGNRALWRGGRGTGAKYVTIAPVYAKWIKEADALWLTQKQKVRPVKLGRYAVWVQLSFPMRRDNQDGDNLMKCVNDWLQRVGIIHNDCLCDSWGGRWALIEEECVVIVTGEPYL
jgi:Holliday junction resolvase RusA-like endonuclease